MDRQELNEMLTRQEDEMEANQKVLENYVQAKGCSCKKCSCNFCPLRGVHCELFGCKSCEKDPDSGLLPLCRTRTDTHLCQSCNLEFPTCTPKQVEFGDGFGNDNVIYCSSHRG